VPASVDSEVPEQRVLEQSMRLGRGGAVSGWGSCRLQGAAYFDGRDPTGRRRPVLLAVGSAGDKLRSDDQARVSREPLPEQDIVLRVGIRCTTPQRALFDDMRQLRDWREGVVAFDMMAAAGEVSLAQMLAFAGQHSRWRRSRRVMLALRLGDERSRSPAETRMRLVWQVDAGLPRPLVNQEIFTLDGRLIGVADLFDPVAGLVGEYDGADHLRVVRRSRDMFREEAFRRVGLEYVDAVGPDLRDRRRLADRIRSTRSRGRFAAPKDRRWSIQPPPGWPREQSLDERLFLREMAAAGERDLSTRAVERSRAIADGSTAMSFHSSPGAGSDGWRTGAGVASGADSRAFDQGAAR